MALSAREMPNGDGQIAWQNIERRALELHAAGMPGTTGQLQVQAMLEYLLGHAIPDPDESARQDAHTDEGAWDTVLADDGACENAHADDSEDVRARQDARASACQDAQTDVNATSHRCAVGTIRSSKLKAGKSNKQSQVCWYG